MAMHMRVVAAACAAIAVAAVASGQVGYTLAADGKSYSITIDGVVWLASSPAAYLIRSSGKTLSSRDGSLSADGAPVAASGSDELGAWTGQTLQFNGGLFEASFKLYAARNALVLGQRFPLGLTGMALTTNNAQDDLTTAFPAFRAPAANTRGYVSWSGCMSPGNVGLYGGAGQGAGIGNHGGPLALFDASGTTIVVSPASAFMTGQVCTTACSLTPVAHSERRCETLGTENSCLISPMPIILTACAREYRQRYEQFLFRP